MLVESTLPEYLTKLKTSVSPAYNWQPDVLLELQGVQAVGALAHELCMHLRCAGPSTVSILSVGMDKIPRGPVLSANVICFSMELATMSLKAYIA